MRGSLFIVRWLVPVVAAADVRIPTRAVAERNTLADGVGRVLEAGGSIAATSFTVGITYNNTFIQRTLIIASL